MKISSIKMFLPRKIIGYSKNTPIRGEYKELYFNNRKSPINNETKSNLSFEQRLKLGFKQIKNHFIK